jgi:hypothetical protein
MISAILSFLGGSAFRMIWGEVSAWINKKLEHQQEMERLAQQEQFAASQHARNLESIRVQAEQQVKVIEVQAQSVMDQLDAGAFLEGVKATTTRTGVKWVDAWNQTIRPGVATWGVLMLSLEALGWLAAFGGDATLSEGTQSVIYAALGLFLADRTLAKRGK